MSEAPLQVHYVGSSGVFLMSEQVERVFRCDVAGILLPNNQRQHSTSHAPKDMLPLRICADYCAPCQPLLRAFSGWIRSPPPPNFYFHEM